MNKADKKDMILNSAEELMCRMDYNKISVDMIAKNAGIGKGSIYYYFESKDDIINAVIERSYSTAIQEYFSKFCDDNSSAIIKIKALFYSIIAKNFNDNKQNIIIALHIKDSLTIHTKMLIIAVKTITPILTGLLEKGVEEGSIHTETPKESAEMIVSMLTILIDNSFFPADNQGIGRKLKLYANILETCLQTEKGSFDFLFNPEKFCEFMGTNKCDFLPDLEEFNKYANSPKINREKREQK